jgi:hypothetical protein
MKVFLKMIQLTIFCIFLLLIYGNFAVRLLKGTLYYCTALEDTSHVTTKLDCFDYGGSWINRPIGFDDIIESWNTLFIVATT